MEIKIESLKDLDSAAKSFIESISDRRVIAFYAPMGTGKTTFIKSLCKHLGVEENVNSPTFAIINVYEGSKSQEIYHMDCYRIDNERDALNLDLDNYFYSGNWCFIEWPENIEKFLPDDCLKVTMSSDKEGIRYVRY